MGKKYLVEQVDEEKKKDEEKEEKKKETLVRKKEKEAGGLATKDTDPALTKKVEEPSTQSGQSKVIPTEPLEKAKALTEQLPSIDGSAEISNAEIFDMLKQILAKLDTGSTEEVEGQPVLEPRMETAVGFGGDTPSGPSLGAKTDIDGGLPKKDTDDTLDKKVEEPSTQSGQSMVIPKQPLSSVKQLSEKLSGRKVLIGGNKILREHASIEGAMKKYTENNGREVY